VPVLDAGEFAGYAGGMPDALEKAMAICKRRAQRNACAVDDKVVWKI
jgi:hypothetical protein